MFKTFNMPVVNFAGDKVSVDGNDTATAKDVAINALLIPDNDLTAIEKFKQYQLAQKLYTSEGEGDFTTEELSLIKDTIGKFYPPLIVGLIYNIIEV